MPISPAVRDLAVHPFRELPVPPDVEVVELDGATVGFNKWPTAQLVRVDGTGPTDVAAAVEASRAAGRERGKTVLAWWVPVESDHLVPALEACGLVNEDTPGFEAVENAMALVEPPSGLATDAVEVRMTETWDDFYGASEVVCRAFGMPESTEAELRERFEEYRRPENPGRGFVAVVDGRVVGTSYAAFGTAGVNLFGGAVAEEARGRGVYRSLVRARWDYAVGRGTPALTVQAGRMSRPICERLGFRFVEAVRVYVDKVD